MIFLKGKIGKEGRMNISIKGKSSLTNLISFYDRVTRLVDEGKPVDVDFSKAFDTVSHSILLEKLAAHVSDRYTLCWVKN